MRTKSLNYWLETNHPKIYESYREYMRQKRALYAKEFMKKKRSRLKLERRLAQGTHRRSVK